MYNYIIIHLLFSCYFNVIHYHTVIKSFTVTICHHITCCHHHPYIYAWVLPCHYSLMMVAVCYRNVGKTVSQLASVYEILRDNYASTDLFISQHLSARLFELIVAMHEGRIIHITSVQVEWLATDYMKFITMMSWLTNNYCGTYVMPNMLRPWQQCRIKMLPDVGMVKVYPKCALKAVHVDWVVTLSRNTCWSCTFSTSWFSMLLPVASETPSTIPTSLLVFVGNMYYSMSLHRTLPSYYTGVTQTWVTRVCNTDAVCNAVHL